MKRFVIGIVILSTLLALGSCITWGFRSIHAPIVSALQQAQAAAAAEDWSTADTRYHGAWQRWQKWHRFTAAFADHAPMEEIDSLFAELEVYARARDKVHFAALCAQLAQRTRAMAESHSPTWWNFL